MPVPPALRAKPWMKLAALCAFGFISTALLTACSQPGTSSGLTGKIGMFPQYSVFSNVLAAEFEWDIAHMPHNADEQRTTRVAGKR